MNIYVVLILSIIPFINVNAAFTRSGFLINTEQKTRKHHKINWKCFFNKEKPKDCVCTVKFLYPKMTSKNTNASERIENSLEKFVSQVDICSNEFYGAENLQVKYRVPVSKFNKYISVVFFLKNENNTPDLWQSARTYNKDTGDVVELREVFGVKKNREVRDILKTFLPEEMHEYITRYRVNTSTVNEMFGIYIDQSTWYLIFNIPHKYINQNKITTTKTDPQTTQPLKDTQQNTLKNMINSPYQTFKIKIPEHLVKI